MLKNVASQIIGAQMVNIADGLAFTGTARVAITIDGGVQDTTPGGTVTHEGRGYHSYNPTQAETNGDILAYTFDDSGGLAVPVTVQVYTIDAIATDVWAEATRTLTAATNITSDDSQINVTSGVIDTVNLVNTTTTNTDVTALNDIAAGDVWAVDATTQQTQGTFGQAIGDPVADTTTIYQSVATDATGDNVAVDVVAVKAETALIVADTGEIGTAGAGLTNINLPNQTMDITGTIDTVTAVTNEVTADVTKISGSATAADNLELSTESIVVGTAQTGTLTTIAMTTNLTITDVDQYKGRIIIFSTATDAGLVRQATDITSCTIANGELGFTALTIAPSNGDTFIIV